MRRRATRIRNQMPRDVQLGEQFRDAQSSLDVVPLTLLRRIEMVYSEPMVLGALTEQPESIEAIRVIDLTSQETVQLNGGLAWFIWRPDRGGAVIHSIDGMSVAANGGRKYRFTFRLTFVPPGGR